MLEQSLWRPTVVREVIRRAGYRHGIPPTLLRLLQERYHEGPGPDPAIRSFPHHQGAQGAAPSRNTALNNEGYRTGTSLYLVVRSLARVSNIYLCGFF